MRNRRGLAMGIHWGAALWAGISAGIVSTAAEILIWIVFTDAFPGVLLRDARLTAAIVMGRGVLTPGGFDTPVMLVATCLHFALSVIYAAAYAGLAELTGRRRVSLLGAGFGAALYAINLYGFTLIFPWFTAAREWPTLAAHVVFGLSCAWTYRCFGGGAALNDQNGPT